MPEHVPAFIRAKARISEQVAEKHGFEVMRGLLQMVTVVRHQGGKRVTEYGNI
jgi:hypothetical protein